jgi:Fe2+ transport system protein FeoA
MHSAQSPRSLWALSKGETCAVLGFDEALPEPYRIRLMEFGFHQGEAVTCLLRPGFGAPRVYRVSNTVFSLDVEIARLVLVQQSTVGSA